MRFYARKRRMPTVIIVSLIDIFAILLIFVIVTTTFKHDQPKVVIQLPESNQGATGPAPSEPIKLTVDKDDNMFLDDKPVSVDDLKPSLEQLVAQSPGRPLALNADTKASFGFIIKILGILKEAGVKDIPAFTEKK
ncbi:MAG TPA: biopolymer transporter ExbD [Chthoniobacteraceae bacterium]|nr:biopolymer transporter ExbD [Chthoniobacteraceae bacterium]